MRKINMIRIWVLLLAASIMMSLVGCGTNSAPVPSEDDVSASSQEAVTTPEGTNDPPEEQTTSTPETTEPTDKTPSQETIVPTERPTTEPITPPVVVPTEPEKDENGLTEEQQRNSLSMLYYLAITAEEIRISRDNRLILDDIYTSLLNDINPGAIDGRTQEHLENLRDIIKSYISISVKRDRLQYIYNQDKAATIRNAVPDPLAILSVTNSFNWKKLATRIITMLRSCLKRS